MMVSVLFPTGDFRRYGALNTVDALKCLAILTMVVDHAGHYFLPDAEWLRVLGRIAAPCFLFLVGYQPTSRNTVALLFWGGVISFLQWLLFDTTVPLNMLITIALTRLAMQHSGSTHPLLLAIAALIALPVSGLLLDYGSTSILFALLGKLRRESAVGWLFACIGVLAFAALFWYVDSVRGGFFGSARAIILLEFCALLYVFARFRMATIGNNLGYSVATIILWLGRNSLWIYVIHVLSFSILSYIILYYSAY